ncbi:transcriptional regulator [Desulfobacterota bacterium AH_259_B03_O07]|nr:transcriptional regulator [Desulfobacterota bacterium AH_259_B03_O07]
MALLDDVSFVKRAKNRIRVLKELDGALMPSELVLRIYGKRSNTYFNIVSRALNELAEAKLVKVANPNSRTGRLYTLKDKGKKVKKFLKNQSFK